MATVTDATRGGWGMPDLQTDAGRLSVVFFRESGQFVAVLPDGASTVRAHTWADLLALAEAKIRLARVQIEIEFIASDTGRRGVATGVHPQSHHPLVRWANGHTETYQGAATPLRPDTDVEELTRLRKAAEQAATAVRRFLEDHRISISVAAMVRRAVDAAAEQSPT